MFTLFNSVWLLLDYLVFKDSNKVPTEHFLEKYPQNKTLSSSAILNLK